MEKLLGLPELASKGGKDVDNLIIYVHYLMIALFIGWICFFFFTLIRFSKKNNPKADYHGVKNHASNYVELVVAAIEGVLLIFVAIPLWAKAADGFPKEEDSTVIQIVAQQFNWNVRYPGKDHAFGKQDMHLVNSTNFFGVDSTDTKGKDDVQWVNEIHVVVNKPVIAYISSKDVIHSFKVLAMRVTQDAIPGMRIPIWFEPIKEGRYQINCAQLCGSSHSAMSGGLLVVESQEAFDKWLASKGTGPAATYD